MINVAYRLYSPRQIRADLIDESIANTDLVVRPTYLSICAADLRYYTGSRGKEILAKKLPMALIHEAVGEVVLDPQKKYKKGEKVVLIPNQPREIDDIIKENYLESSRFKSSSLDGFCQSIVIIDRNRVIPYKKTEDRIAVLSELLSVAMNAVEHFEKVSHKRKSTIGVWGDGNLGYITSLVLKKLYPNSELYIFGKSEKLNYFSFADKTFTIDKIPNDLRIDHAFECVGGPYAEMAIEQIISFINPEGSIALMGVSENNIPINTRMVLEKGIRLFGNSRSSYEDFDAAVKFVEDDEQVKLYLSNIISEEIKVKSIEDIIKAFDNDLNNEFKTVMKWEI